MKRNTVFIISGPLGVGKTTLSKELARIFPNTKLIEGDIYKHPLDKKEKITWEDKIRITWEQILHATKHYLLQGYNVVIDYVVEDELEWFCQAIGDSEVCVKYIVLTTNQETIKNRLAGRNALQYMPRSLRLLEKLTNDPKNQNYLIDNTSAQSSEIINRIIEEDSLVVSF